MLATQSIGEQLAAADQMKFEGGLKQIDDACAENAQLDVKFFVSVCKHLSATSLIGSTERSHRANLVLSRARLSIQQWNELAQAAQTFRREIRNVVVRWLPPKLKSVAYGRPASAISESATEKVVTDTIRGDSRSRKDVSRFHGRVLLLGNLHEQERNIKRLESKHLHFDRATSQEDFRKLLCEDTIAIVIAKSWWTVLPRDKHGAFVEELLRFSSFTCLRINSLGLTNVDLGEKFRALRFRVAKASELLISEIDDINDYELAAIQDAVIGAESAMRVSLHPGDISAEDAKLIAAVANEHVDARLVTNCGAMTELAATTLPGGRSGAMLVQVTPASGLYPFVVKIGEDQELRREMERFRVIAIDHQIDPQLFFHRGRAAILFTLVESPDDPCHPAPTLYEVLRDCMHAEAGSTKECATKQELEILFRRTIAKIYRINSRRCEATETTSLAWLRVEGIQAMDNSGIDWNLPSLPDGRSPLELRYDAASHLEKLQNPCTIHGDIHLRNILVRDYKQPYLIDASYAGPGHPCFDLVRFECALLFQMFRMTDAENVVKEMLLSIRRDGADFSQIEAQFPRLCGGVVNRSVVSAIIDIREACIKLLAEYYADNSHYHAMKLVLSCQALG